MHLTVNPFLTLLLHIAKINTLLICFSKIKKQTNKQKKTKHFPHLGKVHLKGIAMFLDLTYSHKYMKLKCKCWHQKSGPSLLLGRLRTPVWQAFSCGIRHVFIVIQWTVLFNEQWTVFNDHWITMCFHCYSMKCVA